MLDSVTRTASHPQQLGYRDDKRQRDQGDGDIRKPAVSDHGRSLAASQAKGSKGGGDFAADGVVARNGRLPRLVRGLGTDTEVAVGAWRFVLDRHAVILA